MTFAQSDQSPDLFHHNILEQRVLKRSNRFKISTVRQFTDNNFNSIAKHPKVYCSINTQDKLNR